jgi:soluble lytic murein transglycosylase-like protein
MAFGAALTRPMAPAADPSIVNVVPESPVATASVEARTAPPALRRDFPAAVEQWRSLADEVTVQVAATGDGPIDADLLLALVATESSGNPQALSTAGALGLAQLRQPAFDDMVALHPALFPARDRANPRENLLAGALYLEWCAQFLGVDLADPSGLRVALNAYNLGPAAVRALRSSTGAVTLPTETQLHADRILAAYRGLAS